MRKFKNEVQVAGRSYTRYKPTGTFSTTKDIVDRFGTRFYIDTFGIARWDSNSRIPFGDVLLDFCEAGLVSPKELRVSSELREKETSAFWIKLKLRHKWLRNKGVKK
jgi:hypothetical protein